MTKIPSTSFPYLQQMDALIDLAEATANKKDIISMGIQQNLHMQVPGAWILKEIREMATDNYNAVADLIGKKLTDKIMSI